MTIDQISGIKTMRKNCVQSLLLCLVLMPGISIADETSSVGFWDILPEAVLRPIGFMSFVGGSALFIASTPFTAAASIEAPHDAFFNAFNGFVGGPVRYTFTRPIGEYGFEVYPD